MKKLFCLAAIFLLIVNVACDKDDDDSQNNLAEEETGANPSAENTYYLIELQDAIVAFYLKDGFLYVSDSDQGTPSIGNDTLYKAASYELYVSDENSGTCHVTFFGEKEINEFSYKNLTETGCLLEVRKGIFYEVKNVGYTSFKDLQFPLVDLE